MSHIPRCTSDSIVASNRYVTLVRYRNHRLRCFVIEISVGWSLVFEKGIETRMRSVAGAVERAVWRAIERYR